MWGSFISRFCVSIYFLFCLKEKLLILSQLIAKKNMLVQQVLKYAEHYVDLYKNLDLHLSTSNSIYYQSSDYFNLF